jgi:hypothetical protein
MVKYYLTQNPLTEAPDDFAAHVESVESHDKKSIAARMLQRGTLATQTDIVAILNLLEETLADITREGGIINLPLFRTVLSISGKFNSPLDSFDPTRHRMVVNTVAGTLFRALETEIAKEKVSPPIIGPQILEVHDIASDTVNSELTPGGVIRVYGSYIKIVESALAPGCGLFFVPTGTGSAVQAVTFIDNLPSHLTVMVPTLADGTYQLRVKTLYSGSSKPLKHAKTVLSDIILTVG